MISAATLRLVASLLAFGAGAVAAVIAIALLRSSL
jgi:hypothetical protein